MLYLEPTGRRRSRQEAAMIRQALAQGYEVAFPTADQWRYYQRTSVKGQGQH